jgi:hypothetical protein
MDEIKTWLKHYLKSKDVIKREIQEIKDHKIGLLVKYQDRERIFETHELMPEDLLLENNRTYVTYNSRKNFEWLISKWNKLILFDDICIYFINPHSNTEHKWIIYPHGHNKITETATLKQGLKCLYDTVEPVPTSH